MHALTPALRRHPITFFKKKMRRSEKTAPIPIHSSPRLVARKATRTACRESQPRGLTSS
jgi:hypothetical protein